MFKPAFDITTKKVHYYCKTAEIKRLLIEKAPKNWKYEAIATLTNQSAFDQEENYKNGVQPKVVYLNYYFKYVMENIVLDLDK